MPAQKKVATVEWKRKPSGVSPRQETTGSIGRYYTADYFVLAKGSEYEAIPQDF